MVILFTGDIGRTLEYYVNLLGFQLKSHKTIFDASRADFVVIEGYGLRLGLHISEEISSPSGFKIVFRVDDIDEFKGFLDDKGVEYIGPREIAPNLYELEVRDPDGRLLSFISS